MKTFKKYQNRKIYSPDESKYVTVVDVARTSLTDEVKVTDNLTGADITNDAVLSGFEKLLSNEEKTQLVTLAKQLYSARPAVTIPDDVKPVPLTQTTVQDVIDSAPAAETKKDDNVADWG